MPIPSRWLFRIRALFRGKELEADFDEELRYHFDREVERNVARGMTRDEARHAARRAFGNATAVKEEAREAWRWRWLDDLGQDVGYALRILRRAPGFTAVVIATFALGIGANTAVFSVVRSVVLRPLPFPDDGRLAVVLMRGPSFHIEDAPSSPPEYVAYREHTRSWEHLAAFRVRSTTVTQAGHEAERVAVASATPNLFATLRTEPLVGRAFTAEEAQEGADGVAVLSHGFWMSRYGGDPRVIGRIVRLDGVSRAVVGVMPPQFVFPAADVRLWVPLAFTPQDLQARGNHSFSIVGRLRPGVTRGAAERELTALVARLIQSGVRFHKWHPVYVRALRTHMVGDVSRTLWVMLGAVALVLVIACANVANLLLVRSEKRAREMSLRTALGAGRRRLASQLLTESLVLAGAGGLAGLALAFVGVGALRAVAPADLPRLHEISVDLTVLAFTMILTVGAGVLFGLVPALHAGRVDLQGALRDEGRVTTAARKRIRLRQLLVVSETVLAVVLLVAAGLLLQSFRRLMAIDPGFRAERVLTATVTIPALAYPDAKDVVGFYDALLPRVASLPGVSVAGAVSIAPLAGSPGPADIEVDGWVGAPNVPRPTASVQAVTPGYFAAMGIPLVAGRLFEAGDVTEAPLVAVVSEKLARDYWPGRSPLGGRIRPDGDDERFAQVVGVVPDVRQERLERSPVWGTLYLVHAQTPYTWRPSRSMTLTVRSVVEPTSLVSAIRREVQTLDPAVPLYQVRTMEQVVAADTATRRFAMLLQLLFAIVALALSAVGLYGVLAFTVARRTGEIGIRMALGATRADIRRMVVGQGMGLVVIALALGMIGALATGRLLASLLFGVSPGDPLTYAVVLGVLMAVALLACWIPARRASGVDPAEALRAG
jgi:putative ABC transport system permease protein